MSPYEPSDFGALLRQLRAKHGWTQEQLAREAGITVKSVSNLERGATVLPNADTVDRLAAALGVAPEDLDPRRLGEAVEREASSLPRRRAIRRLLSMSDRDIEEILTFLEHEERGGGRRSK